MSNFQQMFGRDNSFRNVQRGTKHIGYCSNEKECDQFGKGIFLLNYHSRVYYCHHCRAPGVLEQERGSFDNGKLPFKEVRVEFDYLPFDKKYTHVAIVRDESLPEGHRIYTLFSPLIKTEKRALMLAEAMLANLNRLGDLIQQGEIPTSEYLNIYLDRQGKAWSREMKDLHNHLRHLTVDH